MIFKSLVVACTILLLSSRGGARSRSAIRWGSGKTNLLDLPETEREIGINQIEPTTLSRTKNTDLFKNHTKPVRGGLLKSSLNVNVNNGDHPWYNPRPNRYDSWRGFDRRTAHQLLRLLDMLPFSNVDYNMMHPDGNAYVYRRKYSTRKAGNTKEGLGFEDLASERDSKAGCYSAAVNALEYLRSVEMNLRNVEQNLKSLLRRLSTTDSYGNIV